MKTKHKLRYTEQDLDLSVKSSFDWVKIFLINVVVSPFRLLNEISCKFLFLGNHLQKNICKVSLVIAIAFLVWNFIWNMLYSNSRYFVPNSVIISCIGIFSIMYYNICSNEFFQTELSEEHTFAIDKLNELENEKLDFDPEELESQIELEKEFSVKSTKSEEPVVLAETTEATKDAEVTLDKNVKGSELDVPNELSEKPIFNNIKPDKVTFDDALSLFIDDPNELVGIGVNPVSYQEAETTRHLDKIMESSDKFPSSNIEIDFSEKPKRKFRKRSKAGNDPLEGIKSIEIPLLDNGEDIEILGL